MDQIHVPLNQSAEGWFGPAADVIFQEFSALAHRLFISKDPLKDEIRQRSLRKFNHGLRGLRGFSVSEQSEQSVVNFGCVLPAPCPCVNRLLVH
jgi:hypothetical protein